MVLLLCDADELCESDQSTGHDSRRQASPLEFAQHTPETDPGAIPAAEW